MILIIFIIFCFVFIPSTTSTLQKQGDDNYIYHFFNNNVNMVEMNSRSISKLDSYRTIYYNSNNDSTLLGPMDSPWPMQSYNSKHLGRSPYTTYNTTGIEKWRVNCGWITDTPVIDNEGIIYFSGEFHDNPDYLFAIYPNGTTKWLFETDGAISGCSPAIAKDGTLTLEHGNVLCSPSTLMEQKNGELSDLVEVSLPLQLLHQMALFI